jgi:hypothetical protein
MKKIAISEFLSSKYAISLTDAKNIIEKNQPSEEELVFDFSNIEIATSPFIRTILVSCANPKIENANEMISDKWKQVMEEKNDGFDVYKVIEEIES